MRASWAVLLLLAALLGCDEADRKAKRGRRPAPVEVGEIRRGPLVRTRTFSGALETPAEITVAAQVEGRIEAIPVDLGDRVTSGQVLARLEDEAFVYAARQAAAELAIARAQAQEATRAAELAGRDLSRVEKLRARGVSSEAQLDAARTEQVARRAAAETAKARVAQAEARRDAARLELAYTRMQLTWADGSTRVIARRHVDVGALVAPRDPVLTVVALDPVEVVTFVPEAEYGYLEIGQRVAVRADARPGQTFEGRVARIAPVFEPGSRQARIEVEVHNPKGALAPGMFVRATVDLEEVEGALSVPKDALTNRDEVTGVFLVQGGDTVTWRPVKVGLRAGDRVQILEPDLPPGGEVVTLGHQLLDEGRKIRRPAASPGDAETNGAKAPADAP